eukprot:TRINITY_DN46751_c0_g1_i1.p1 TRINITY_DN46751_c0_g1~~TRINITY_DN46751_c0_g1_i1.p1  ORF type:complete len:397 (+),score=160.86 TRINITY_DN46751_c0_g1_i1:37-1227(+)
MFTVRLIADALGVAVDVIHAYQYRPTMSDVEATLWQAAEGHADARLRLLSCADDCRLEQLQASAGPTTHRVPLLAASQLVSGCCVHARFTSGVAAAQVAEAQRASAEQRRTTEARLRAARAEHEWLELRQRSAEARQRQGTAQERSRRCEELLTDLRRRELESLGEIQRLRGELRADLPQPPRIAADLVQQQPRPRADVSPPRHPCSTTPLPLSPPRREPSPPRLVPHRSPILRRRDATVRHEVRLRDAQEPAGFSFRVAADGRLIAANITPGGPADLAGLTAGAAVRRVNGVEVTTLDDVRGIRSSFYGAGRESVLTVDVEAPVQEDVEAEIAARRVREEERRLDRRRRELEPARADAATAGRPAPRGDASPPAPKEEPAKAKASPKRKKGDKKS